MKLTPLDIRHKEFKRGMRGYADVEVDEFLDEVADEYERLFKENIDLQERVEALEDKVAGYKRIEETLQKTLVNAQASAEEQKQNASKEAQLILQDAELKGRQLVNDAYSERQTIEQNMAKLRSAEEDFRFKFKTLLESYLRQLKESPEATADVPDHSTDFARHAEAIKEAIARESAPAEPQAPAPAPEVAAQRRPEEPESREAPVTKRDEAVVTPARGPGGVQAGVPPRRPAPDDADDTPETTAGPTGSAPGDGPQASAEGDADDEDEERVVLGESDDLLADVDTGVNENEFKW